MKTYFHSLSCPASGLARYGVTLIPPESLLWNIEMDTGAILPAFSFIALSIPETPSFYIIKDIQFAGIGKAKCSKVMRIIPSLLIGAF
ncbi:MAG: hypothetical protein Q4C66_05160 [Lachnospiraceae bacterium]|nr:hypothetical protein [Lachnospiraceae bacterium]